MNTTTKFSAAEIAENRKRWAAALRSGEWKQCRKSYNRGDHYCCLGVLNQMFYGDAFGPAFCIPRDNARSAAGLTDCQVSEFIDANDVDGKTFAEIADMVDALPAPEVSQ